MLVLAAPRLAQNRALAAAAPEAVDALELRVDLLEPEDQTPEAVAAFVRGAGRPIIATCRGTGEGGAFAGSDDRALALLGAALEAGAELVDLDIEWWRRDPRLAGLVPPERRLLSDHRLDPRRGDPEDRLIELLGVGARAVKMVVSTESFRDAVRLVEMTRTMTRGGRAVTCFAVGAAARASRILGFVEGAFLTFLRPDDGPTPSPDLLTVSEALDVYRLQTLSDSVKLVGLLGYPIGHSQSPRMHNQVIRYLGERYLYVPFESTSAEDVVEFARRQEVRGLSVTRPHKEAVLSFVDTLDETARRTGAVNTLVFEGGVLTGYNTDLLAMRDLLAEWGLWAGDRAVVLGAGGAARAMLAALRERRIPAVVVNRSAERGRRLAESFGATWGGDSLADVAGPLTLLVNATPLGVNGEEVAIPAALAASGRILDLAYRPDGTPLERQARIRGLTVVDGLDFLARQGAEQFALWARRVVHVDIFRRAVHPMPAGALDAE